MGEREGNRGKGVGERKGNRGLGRRMGGNQWKRREVKDGSREGGREGGLDGGRRWEMGNRGEGERGGERERVGVEL